VKTGKKTEVVGRNHRDKEKKGERNRLFVVRLESTGLGPGIELVQENVTWKKRKYYFENSIRKVLQGTLPIKPSRTLV